MTPKNPITRGAQLLTATALVAALGGCYLTHLRPTTPDPTDTPTSVETATETPTPDPVVEPLTIPGCTTLLTEAKAQSIFDPSTVYLEEVVPTAYRPWIETPSVLAAISGVTVASACWFGIPESDGSFYFMVAEVDAATRTQIEAGLDAAGFSSVAMGTVTAREAEIPDAYQAETNLFTGNVWIIADAPTLEISGSVAGAVLDSMRTANPTLGL